MLTFIKLGGSLITDKRAAEHFHAETTALAAAEIARAFAARPDQRLLIGHGSGSFGHVAAQKHGTMQGVHSAAQWIGFAEVAAVARRLNHLVFEALREAGLPAFPIGPSSSARCAGGKLVEMAVTPVELALAHGLVPLVYGDVAFDEQKGGTIISTEAIFTYLAGCLRPGRMFLLGETEGVYGADGQVIPVIDRAGFARVEAQIGGSGGTDVTGGMIGKVRAMLDLVAAIPGLEVRIFGGTTPGQIEAALRGDSTPGTVIRA